MQVGKLLWDAQASDDSARELFWITEYHRVFGSFTEFLCSVELQKTQWNSVSPKQKEVTGIIPHLRRETMFSSQEP
jgi:hypothetical protein